jgi:hypothetical protein
MSSSRKHKKAEKEISENYRKNRKLGEQYPADTIMFYSVKTAIKDNLKLIEGNEVRSMYNKVFDFNSIIEPSAVEFIIDTAIKNTGIKIDIQQAFSTIFISEFGINKYAVKIPLDFTIFEELAVTSVKVYISIEYHTLSEDIKENLAKDGGVLGHYIDNNYGGVAYTVVSYNAIDLE